MPEKKDTNPFYWLESILQDARFGVRMLRKHAVVTTAAIFSLALAIGASTAAFSLIDALILRKLPVRQPDQLISFTYPDRYGRPIEDGTFNYAFLERFRGASSRQADLFGIADVGQLRSVVFDDAGGQEEKIRPESFTVEAFTILGVQPTIGRLFTANDDGPTRPRVAVLSYSFWNRRFGKNPGVLGKWMSWDDKQFQIIGVASKGFNGLEPGYGTDLWVPMDTSDSTWLGIWARPKAGVAPEQLRQILQPVFNNFRREHAREMMQPGSPPDLVAKFVRAPLHVRSAARGNPTLVRAEFTRPLWILAIVVGLVLLIACSNVANLLLARAVAREREMAMRVSIGARRMRLIQQLLIESGLVALTACILGLAFASATAPQIVSLLSPADYPAYLDLHIDWRILAFVTLLCAATTVLFGLLPALRASAVSPHETLKAAGPKHSGSIGILRPLLAAQVGFSFTVLFVGGLLLLSFQKLTNVDLGFSKAGLILFTLQSKDLQGTKAQAASLELLDHIRQLPNVQSASMSAQGLVGGNFMWIMTPSIRIPGRESESVRPRYLAVSPGFFSAMQIKLLDGREFIPRDMDPKSDAVVVNQSFAARYFPGENPLGRRFERIGDDPHPVQQEIVGVVRDSKYSSLREPPSPTAYEPLRGVNATLEVRAAGDPLALTSFLRAEIPRINPALRVNSVTLQTTRINNTLLRERLLALLAGFFAMVALTLAAIGLYGVLTYSVLRRTKEIGIRVALGARQSRVVTLVISDCLLMILIGIGAGAAGGVGLARFVSTLLFEVKAMDLWSLSLPLGALLLTSAIALLPAVLRAARVDPIQVLREE